MIGEQKSISKLNSTGPFEAGSLGFLINLLPGSVYNFQPPLNCIYWTECRDVFHYNADGLEIEKTILYHRSPVRIQTIFFNSLNDVKHVHKIISEVEKHLKIEESVISPTDNKRIMQIDLSPFWIKRGIRHAFFTAMLKSECYSLTYLKDTYYFTRTRKAFDDFMAGKTWLEPDSFYWITSFVKSKRELVFPPTTQ